MALNYIVLGERIRKLRTERRISQAQLADMIDRSPTFVSRLERGEKGPSLDTLVLIADSLHTSLDSLLENNRTTVLRDRIPGVETEFFTCTAYEQFILYRCMIEIRNIIREGESLRKTVS